MVTVKSFVLFGLGKDVVDAHQVVGAEPWAFDGAYVFVQLFATKTDVTLCWRIIHSNAMAAKL